MPGRNPTRLLVAAALLVVACRTLPAGALPASSIVDAALSPAETSFVELMNLDRSGAGLAPVSGDPALVDIARRHSQRMRDAGRVFHNPNLLTEAPQPWAAIAENVGAGTSVDFVHRKFMRSPEHRGNILGGYDRVGVGVAVSSRGRVYVTEIFVRSR